LCRGRREQRQEQWEIDSRQGTALLRSTARNRHSFAGTCVLPAELNQTVMAWFCGHAASSVARPNTHGRGAKICAAVAGCTRLTLVLWAGVEPWQTQRIYGAACNGARAALGAEGEGARERRAAMKILWRIGCPAVTANAESSRHPNYMLPKLPKPASQLALCPPANQLKHPINHPTNQPAAPSTCYRG
jgi:hypothetical protein